MSTKEIVEFETSELAAGHRDVLHLHHEGSFLRAYEWSAFLACRYLHDFKVTKRVFKGVEQPVAFIGFPETSINKWMPEGAEQTAVGEKHLAVRLPKELFGEDTPEAIDAAFTEWKEAVPLSESQAKGEKKVKVQTGIDLGLGKEAGVTLTSVMQRILAFPIESKSPLESMAFLADVKRQLATMI
jgi:hypothetical protein